MEAELHAVYDTLVNHLDESAYLRLVSVKWPIPFDYPGDHRQEVGRGWIVREGVDARRFRLRAVDAGECVRRCCRT